MWNFSSYIVLVLVIVVLSGAQEIDLINNLLNDVKNRVINENDAPCKPTEFITKMVANVKLPQLDKLQNVTFSGNSSKIQLDFIFEYADRNTSLVNVERDGVLILRNKIGDIDRIAPLPRGNITSRNNSTVDYYKTNEYFLVRWNNLKMENFNSSIQSIYNVAIIIYKSGEILISYGDLIDDVSVPTQIVFYFKLTQHKSYEYYGPSLSSTDLTKETMVYVNECPSHSEPPLIGLTVNTNGSQINLENELSKNLESDYDDEPYSAPIRNETKVPLQDILTKNLKEKSKTENMVLKLKTIAERKSKPKNDLDHQLKSTTNDPSIENKPPKETVTSTHKLNGTTVLDVERSNYLFDLIDSEPKSKIPQTIDFNFKFNNILFQTFTIESEVKILLNSKAADSPQIQVEPVPQTKGIVIKQFDLKWRTYGDALLILLDNLTIHNSSDNQIILAFDKSGTIEIIYKNLVNSDIDEKTVVLHTLRTNGGVTVIEGEINFKDILNGTMVRFGNRLPDLLRYFVSVADSSTKDVPLLNKFYDINVDEVGTTFQDGRVTMKFFNGTENIYITNSMVLYNDTDERRIQIVPDAEKFINLEFKCTTTSEYISVTWTDLQTVSQAGVTTTYNLRVLILATGQILILFKDVKTEKLPVPHIFIKGHMTVDLETGTIVHIASTPLPPIPQNDKSVDQLIDDITSKLVEKNASIIFTGRDFQTVDQIERTTQLITPIDFNNSKSCPINLQFELCGTKQFRTVHLTKMMQLSFDDNTKVKLVPDADNVTETSFKLINQINFVSMKWTNLKVGTVNYNIRLFIYPNGDVIILYVSGSSSNVFIHATDPIGLEDGTVVKINVCNIEPILFQSLLTEFTPNQNISCINPEVAYLNDVKLHTYMTLDADTTQVTEYESKLAMIRSEFEIEYESEIKLQTIYVAHSVQLYLRDDAKINLVPTDGDEFSIEANFRITSAKTYVTLTWTNLIVKTEGTSIAYRQIRVIIFPSGDILIMYDIDQIVPNVFVTGTNEIELKRGLIVKIDACTLVARSVIPNPSKTFFDLLDEFDGSTRNVIQLNEVEFNHYMALSTDTGRPVCFKNLCTIKSKFNITYGDTKISSFYVTNLTKIFFDEQASLSLVRTDPFKNIENGLFYYTAGDDYVTMSWRNLTVHPNRLYDIRVIIYAKGDVVVLYQFIDNEPGSTMLELLPMMEKKIINRSVAKITMRAIFEHLRPRVLLAEVQSVKKVTDHCTTRLNDERSQIFKTLFAIKKDAHELAADQTTIPTKFSIKAKTKFSKNVTFFNRTKFYFDDPTQFYDLVPFPNLILDATNLKMSYTENSEYISLSLTNVTFTNGGDYSITLDARAVIYPTGDLIFGYKSLTDSVPQFMMDDTEIELTNGTIILKHTGLCKKFSAVLQIVDEIPLDEALTGTANRIILSYMLVVVLNLVVLSVFIC